MQKWRPMLINFKQWRPTFAEKQVKAIFWRSDQNTVGKICPTTFWASLGKFGQKSFVPQKMFLLLHLCSAKL